MIPQKFRLLIHHHDIAYVDVDDALWLTAGIGRWVDALADSFQEIGLLLHQSSTRLARQDTLVENQNVKLYSLGCPGYYFDHFSRMKRIREICGEIGKEVDGLLIRGITPLQYLIWRSISVPHKAFLLVGSPMNTSFPGFSILGTLAWFRSHLHRYEFKKMIRSGTALMANSPVSIAELKALYGFDASFIPTNIVRKSEFAPLAVRPVSNTWQLLYCGRLDMQKGLRELFHAIAVLKRQGQPCILHIVALIKEPVFSQLMGLALHLEIADQIRWHGSVTHGPELYKYYQDADALVLPTYTEGFPRVIWEAAGNSCPVVTTNVGGIPGLWKNEKHGLLVPPKNVQALVQALQRLFTEEGLRQSLVTQAYLHANEFTIEICAQKLADTLAREWNLS